MSEASKANKQNKAFLEMLGVLYGEKWISFRPTKHTLKYSSASTHMESIQLALQLTLPEHKVVVREVDQERQVLVNDQVVITYKPHWFTGELQYKRRRETRLEIKTVAYGDFASGMIDIVFGAVGSLFGSSQKTEEPKTVIH